MIRLYLWNLGVSLSQLVHTVLGGDPDESVSGATGKASLQEIWWFKTIQEPFINWIFKDPNHCRNSIEPDEGDSAIFPWYDRGNPVWKREQNDS